MPWFNDSFLYPNLYIVLIGKSTIMRKSESINLAVKMIRTINNDRIFPSQFTQEALFGLLQDKPVRVISWAELQELYFESIKIQREIYRKYNLDNLIIKWQSLENSGVYY